MSDTPKISIGIPIYHGEIHLEETLKNIMDQSFTDFEVIIADNNPGGEPEKVAESYAFEYENISYIKHEKNQGALENWNSLIKYARGDLFICAGGHDLWSENFLADLYRSLGENEDAVLTYAPSYWMEDPLEDSRISTGFFDTSGQTLVQRINAVFWGPEEALYGLMRMEAIRKTRLQAQIIGSGAVWLMELALQGQFILAPGIRRYRRKNRSEENRHERLRRYHRTLFRRKKRYWLPFWKFGFYYLSIPFLRKISFHRRGRIFISILSGFLVKYGPELGMDLINVLMKPFRKYG